MFTRLFGTPYEKLIGAIKAENELEARKLIAQMNITELSKVDNDGVTALTLAARQGKRVEKICEMLIPKMNAQGINYINNEGNTALTIDADRELEKTCELLVNKMSNEAINQVTKDGNTVLTVAAIAKPL